MATIEDSSLRYKDGFSDERFLWPVGSYHGEGFNGLGIEPSGSLLTAVE